MAIIGRDLVALIQGTIESKSRRDQQSVRQTMADASIELLKPFGLESRALEVFDLLRRNEVKFAGRDEGSKRETAITEELLAWGVPSFSQANELADALHDTYKGKPRTLFLNTRSIAAHVGAVLRPFKRRYRDGWADAGVNNFDLEATVAEVERLNAIVINNDVELIAWSNLVYGLFSKVAVLSEDTYKPGVSTEQKPRRPLGMISSSSERTYRQQWSSWIDDNLKTLLSDSPNFGITETAGLSSPDIGFSQAEREAIYDQYPYTATPVKPVAATPPVSSGFQSVSVRVTDSSDSTLTAERGWLDRPSAIVDVPAWANNLGMFWGQERNVTIQLEFATPSGESKITLPATALELAADRIVSVLNSYV